MLRGDINFGILRDPLNFLFLIDPYTVGQLGQCSGIRATSVFKFKWYQQTLVRYSSDLLSFSPILNHWLRLKNGPKMANFGPKTTIFGHQWPRRLRWLAKVDQRVDHSVTHVETILDAKLDKNKHVVLCCVVEMAHFWPNRLSAITGQGKSSPHG